MKKNLLDIINEVLSDSNKKIDSIIPETNLRTDLDFDSLKLAHLTVLIEDEYGIDVFENGLVEKISDILEKLNG